MDKVEEYWKKWVSTRPEGEEHPYGGEISFGIDEQMSIYLTSLVLTGKKQATSSALEGYALDNEPVPVAGVYMVLTDYNGEPLGIMYENQVDVLPYDQITWSLAQKEGENDDMTGWRADHDEFFTEEADIMGYEFRPDMPVVFEQFNIVYKG